jgi:hypothetical protein
MNNRLSLSSLPYYLPLILGITLWQLGCGGGGVPSAVYTGEDPRVPAVILTDLMVAGDPVMVGIGSYYIINWEPVNPPPDAIVRMYLSLSGDFDSSSFEITPNGGVSALDNAWKYSPFTGQGETGVDYTLIARLSSNNYLFDTAKSVRKIRIGAGGIIMTYPTAPITLARGLPVQVTWGITNNICETLTNKAKIIKLFVDTVPDYKDGRSIEITPTDGIDACLNQFDILTGEIKGLQLNTPYYIIARLFIDTVENSRMVAAGTFTTTASLVATEPSKDIQKSSQNNFKAIPVSWQVLGRDPSGLKVEILAVLPGVKDDVDRIISPDGGYDGVQGTGAADASLLPTGTYNVAVRLYTRDSKGAKIILDTATAPGKLTVPSGYNGIYDLINMAAIKTKNYSPLVGTIFEGFNIGDEIGYEVAGLGDLEGKGFSDFMIFARFGQEYTGGNAGEAYLIYGKSTLPPIVSLNSIASPSVTDRPVEGTVIPFPMENLARYDTVSGDFLGQFKALGIPDISFDGKGDLMIGCPEARPLMVEFLGDPTADTTLKGDQYGLPRKIEKGAHWVEPCHVHSTFRITDDSGTYVLQYPNSYDTGDRIKIEVVSTSPMLVLITVYKEKKLRGTGYLVTSDQLLKYKNKFFDLAAVGSPAPADSDGLTDMAKGQMFTWFIEDEHFGSDISILPNIDGTIYPQYIFTVPDATAHNQAVVGDTRLKGGVAMIFDSNVRWWSLRNLDQGWIAWMAPRMYAESSARQTIVNSSIVDIIGAQNDSMLTGAAGLGRYTSLTDRSGGSYIKGDFNGDGVPDIVVGSPGVVNPGGGTGAIYVLPIRPVFGHRLSMIDLKNFNQALPAGTDTSVEVPVVGIKLMATDPSMRLGEIVRPAGDFNGDDLADVMYGLPNLNAEAGRVVLMFGKKDFYGDFTIDNLDSHLGAQLPGLIFDGAAPGDHLGQRIIATYDVNGDGIDDILMAAPDAGVPGKPGCGKIYLLYGKKNIIKTDPASGFQFVDYDGDGRPDNYWSVNDIGGKLPGAVFIGEAAGNHLQAIAPTGDVNGDGIGDFIIGAPFTNISAVQQKAGKAYLILGQKYVVQ